MTLLKTLVTILFGVHLCSGDVNLKFLIVVESQELQLQQYISEAISKAESKLQNIKIVENIILLDRRNEDEAYDQLCSFLSNGVSIVLDLSWTPWLALSELAETSGVPLVRSQLGSQGLVSALNSYLEARNATDAALIFEDENDLDRGLYELLYRTSVRLWVHSGFDREAAKTLKSMRPDPNFYAIVGTKKFVQEVYKRASRENLLRFPNRWTIVQTDFDPIDQTLLMLPTAILSADIKECCLLLDNNVKCVCPENFNTEKPRKMLTPLITYIAQTFTRVQQDLSTLTLRVNCQAMEMAENNGTRDVIYRQFGDDTDDRNGSLLYWNHDRLSLLLRTQFNLHLLRNDTVLEKAAAWNAGTPFQLLPDVELPVIRRFFRIGTSAAIPWTMLKFGEDGKAMVTENDQPVYEGYCIDFIQKLSEHMDFDYEIITPKLGSFGEKLPNGTWDGLVGDLVRGEIDFAVAALTMTAEREEVIDFVPPYFDQTGILIVIRKPTRKTSLFKFMTVLRSEVWMSIVAALVLTAFMIWLLDKYSPYSARNNPEAYPYPCRNFTLKESFWFALTSFTPQGGGEAPKALSGRTLVAAYWLFVVLMLATFTANLAAFLTVERMQAPVSSLEQLARQSRINYTVVESSSVHQYFINMKHAEDTLYRVWKEITLNATSDQAQYRVWDYPIREQYGHILLAINASGPVPNASHGFREVEEHTDADFAFIHDAAEVKYEVTKNCNLTEVGEVFAEQPYAVAVQQGSKLQEEISKAILDLQKDRYLELLTNKYWNISARSQCPDSDESEGITLESLGGVFIATLVGLGLAMLTLLWEVLYYKRKERNQVQILKTDATLITSKEEKKEKDGGLKKSVTIGGSFKPAMNKPNVAFIKVNPKNNFGYQP